MNRFSKRLFYWLRGKQYDPLIDDGRRIRLVPPAHLLAGIAASGGAPAAEPGRLSLSAAGPRPGSGKKRSGGAKTQAESPAAGEPIPARAFFERRAASRGRAPLRRSPRPPAGAAPGEAALEDGETRQQNGYNGYRHFLTPEERDDARRTQELPITVEINIFRVQLKKMLRLAAEISSLDEMVQFTNSYGLALLRISRLLETEQDRGAGADSIQAQLPEILKKVNEELDHELNQQLPLFP